MSENTNKISEKINRILDKVAYIVVFFGLGILIAGGAIIFSAVYEDATSGSSRIPFGATIHQGKPVEYDITGSEGDATIVKARTREPGEKTNTTKDIAPKEITPKTLIGGWEMPDEVEEKTDCDLGIKFKNNDELEIRRDTGNKYLIPARSGGYIVNWQGKTTYETYKYKIRDMRPSPDNNMQVGIMELYHIETQEILANSTEWNTIKGSGELTYQCVFGIAKEDPRYMCIAFFGPNEEVSYDMPEQDKVYTLEKVY